MNQNKIKDQVSMTGVLSDLGLRTTCERLRNHQNRPVVAAGYDVHLALDVPTEERM